MKTDAMKTILKSILFCGAVVLAGSCAKEASESSAVKGYPFTLDVTSTKTTLDGGKTVLWAADDQLGIICRDAEGKYKKVSDGTTGPFEIENKASYSPSTCASFTGELTSPDYTPAYVVYPYNASAIRHSSVENIVLSEIKSIQTGVKDGFPVGTPMVGEIVDGSASLKNVGALLKIKITRNDVKSVTFSSNSVLGSSHLAGTIYANAQTGEIDRFKSNLGDDFVKLIPSGDVFEPGMYWLCCASQRSDYLSNNLLPEGFTVEIETAAGFISRSLNSSFTISRNSVINLGTDEGVFPEIHTAVAAGQGSSTGSTATLYGVVSKAAGGSSYFFEYTSDSGIVTVPAVLRELDFDNDENVIYTADLTGLTPGTEYSYRFCATNGGKTIKGSQYQFIPVVGESVTLDLTSSLHDEYWPFSNVALGDATDATASPLVLKRKGTSTSALFAGVEGTLTTIDGYSFVFKGSNGLWNGAHGLVRGKAKNDYIQFPVIPGKALSKVIFYAENVAGSNPSITDVAGVVVPGGTAWTEEAYVPKTWVLNDSSNQAYRMTFGAAQNTYFYFMELVYETYSEPENVPIVLNVSFSNGVDAMTQPFMNASGDEFKIQNSARNSESDTDYGPLYLKTDATMNYPFHLIAKQGTYEWRLTNGGGFNMYVTGDEIQVPGISGYYLKNIEFSNSRNKTANLEIYENKSEGELIGSVSFPAISPYTERKTTVEIPEAKRTAGLPYRFVATSDKACGLIGFTLTYEKQ